ncbi:phage tail tape measure protein [Proteinivorax hydrogeniformans]|uniref:Phage tail tape measure protein n=1 Tax=Proteinivorax hydrogeniformans TaxID=1826727 RepID=A0AAU8HT30_9FIRM
MAEVGSLNVRVGLDATGFQNGISNINQQLRKVQSEFKLASSEIGKHGGELDKLRAKSDTLTNQKALQSRKVEALRQAHQRSVETKGADAKATQNLEIKLNQAQTRLNYMEQDLKNVNREIAKQSTSWYQMGKALEPVGQKMQAVGKQMGDVGKNLTKKVTLPLVGIGTAAVKVGSDFQAGMSEVQAISGATGDEIKALEDIAKEMGSTTKFSATQSAEGLKYMALAGWDTKEMVAALPGVLDLAAAANMNLAQASDIVTDTMSAFQMEAKEAETAVDIFAATSSKSNTDVRQLGEAMRYAGASANAAGMDLVHTNTALAIFADSGIKGSQAGTTFAAVLRDIRNSAEDGSIAIGETAVAVYDAEGNMRDLGSIMADVEAATKGMSDAQRDAALGAIFGEQAMRGVNIMLAEGSEKYTELEAAIRGSDGAAGDMASTMQDNLQGELTKLKSALEGVAIQIFEVLVPHLNTLVASLQNAVAWFSNLDESTQETIIKVAALVAAIGPLLIIGGKIVSGAGAIIGVFSKISIAIAGKTAAAGTATAATGGLVAAKGALATAATVLTGPIGLAVAAVAALTVGGIALARHLREDSIPAVDLFGDEVSASTEEAVGGFMELNEEATIALNQLSWSGQTVTEEMAEGITSNFTQMAEQVQAGLDEHHEESLAKMQDFVSNSAEMSEQEQQEVLENMQTGYENRKQAIADGEARIKEILDTASEEKRALTKSEQEEINAIQQEMVETGIQALSESELESKVIMERMRAQAGELSALQAAEVVQNSIEQKEGAIEAAKDQHDEVIREIIRQRDEAGSITKEQADRLIQEAARQKEESIKNAKEMHDSVISEAKIQANEHVDQVDWQTGEVLSRWGVMKNSIAERSREIGDSISNSWNNVKNTTTKTWDDLKSNTSESWQNMRDTISENGGGIQGTIRTFTNRYRKDWENSLTAMDDLTGGRFSSMADKVSESFSNIGDSIQSGIDRLRSWNEQRIEDKEVTITQKVQNITENITSRVPTPFQRNFQGTSFFQGGLTMVGELGPELVELPRGSKIYNDYHTEQILDKKADINHTGTIKVVGVSNQNELYETVDIIMDRLRQEARG